MAVNITYFVHGTTTDNEQRVASGWKDAELSALGITQSRELGEKTKDTKFDVVFSSDLKRAYDSAVLAFSERGVPIIKDARLRECNYGEYNGKPEAIVEPLAEHSIAEPFPKGESYEDVKRRIAEFLRFVRHDYDGKTVAVVAHKAPQLALDVLLTGKTWAQAFAGDWRKTKSWQAGWEYIL